MLWILALLAVAALAKRSVQEGSSGHAPLEETTSYKLGPYTVIVGKDEGGLWDWRAWTTKTFENVDDVDGLEQGQGFDHASQAEAKAEAVAWVTATMEPVPGPLGLSPAEASGVVRHGVRMSDDCSNVSVTDIEAWLNYATPVVQAYDVEEPTAEGAMMLALGGLFPFCDFETSPPKIRGKSWAQTAKRVNSTIEKIRAGELLSVEDPEAVVAARLVNMSVPKIPGAMAVWHTGENNGNRHAIVSLPGAAGQWRYYVWVGPRRGLDEAWKVGVSGSSKDAIREGKRLADEYFNAGGA